MRSAVNPYIFCCACGQVVISRVCGNCDRLQLSKEWVWEGLRYLHRSRKRVRLLLQRHSVFVRRGVAKLLPRATGNKAVPVSTRAWMRGNICLLRLLLSWMIFLWCDFRLRHIRCKSVLFSLFCVFVSFYNAKEPFCSDNLRQYSNLCVKSLMFFLINSLNFADSMISISL